MIGNATNQTSLIPTMSLMNTSTFSGRTTFANYTYETSVSYVSGLLANSSEGVNHFQSVPVDGQNAVDGLVAVMQVKIVARPAAASSCVVSSASPRAPADPPAQRPAPNIRAPDTAARLRPGGADAPAPLFCPLDAPIANIDLTRPPARPARTRIYAIIVTDYGEPPVPCTAIPPHAGTHYLLVHTHSHAAAPSYTRCSAWIAHAPVHYYRFPALLVRSEPRRTSTDSSSQLLSIQHCRRTCECELARQSVLQDHRRSGIVPRF